MVKKITIAFLKNPIKQVKKISQKETSGQKTFSCGVPDSLMWNCMFKHEMMCKKLSNIKGEPCFCIRESPYYQKGKSIKISNL